MLGYTFEQLVFFFLIYCFVGWIIESTWVSLHQKRFVNRGFMRGPVIPIYGSGAMMLLLASGPFMKYPVAVFFAGMISCSILEYFTGAAMEAIFKVRYWDYSNEKFNLNGHICLKTSFFWGLLAIALNYFLHKPVEYMAFNLPPKLIDVFTVSASAIFIVDLTLSFKAAFDLRSLIIAAEKAKYELKLLEKRIDVIIAFAEDDIEEQRERRMERIDNLSENLEQRMEDISDDFDNRVDALTDSILARSEKIRELSHRFFDGLYNRGIFLGNPGLSSKKFKGTIEELKEYVESHRGKHTN